MTREKKWPETLGNTVEEIVESLKKQGARGIPGCSKNCIIARSYKLQYPNGWSGLRVGIAYTTRDDGSKKFRAKVTFNDWQICDPHMPREFAETLGEFIHRFDKEEFPELHVAKIPTEEEVLAKLSVEERIAIGR